MTKQRFLFSLLSGLVLLFATAAATVAQPAVFTDDEYKVNTYKRFTDNRVPNPDVAYEAARDYMAKYGKENDRYTSYLKEWMSAYEEDERMARLAAERADREQQLLGSFTTKDFTKAYGLAKQVLTDDPNNLRVLIALGYGAVAASTEARNETFNAEAAKHAEKAIQLIESGKAPMGEGSAVAPGLSMWAPFKNREDVLASLNYALGFYSLKTAPESAIPRFINAAHIDSDRKTAPSTYYYLALAYQNGPYKRLSDDYSKRFANQPESAEGKAALDKINGVLDRIVDAYARAVALAGTLPQHQAAKAQWTTRLTELYKYRHENSDVGLTEYIAKVLSTPLPQP